MSYWIQNLLWKHIDGKVAPVLLVSEETATQGPISLSHSSSKIVCSSSQTTDYLD